MDSSTKAIKHFFELDTAFSYFLKSVNRTDTTVIVTADHGLVDTTKSRVIDMAKHPRLAECLVLPLCGDKRLAYCYVRPSKQKTFESYVKTKLRHACDIHKSESLIKKNFFGLFKPHPRLFDRVGDYALIMKDNFVIKDSVPGEKSKFHIGNHGGTSKEEMYVPLIVVKP